MRIRNIILLLIIILAILLRLFNINSEMTVGEKVTFSIIEKEKIDENFLISYISGTRDLNPPLYHYIMFALTKLFGSSLLLLRLFSFFFSILSVYLIYNLSKMLFNYEVGLVTALILALNEPHIFHSLEGRMYSMLVALVLASFLFFFKIVNNPLKKKYYVYYSIITVIAMLTHYAFIGCIIAQNIIFFYKNLKNKRCIKLWLICQGIILLIFLPYNPIIAVKPYILENGYHIKFCSLINTFYFFSTNIVDSNPSIFFFEDINIYTLNILATSLFIVFLFLFFVAIFFNKHLKFCWKISFNKLVLLIWMCVPIILRTFYYDLTIPCAFRHVIVSSLPFYILVAEGLFKLKRIRLILLLIIIILSFFLIFY